MPTITWKGEPGVKDQDAENTWKGVTFKKGEAVECNDPYMLAKAYNNPQYEVSGWKPKGEEEGHEEHKPPSQQSAQRPVPKAGEPVKPGEEPAGHTTKRV